MTVNRTTLLDLPLPVTGTESGTWGDTTNNGLSQYMDIAIAGMNSLTSANFTAGALTIANTQGDSSATNIAAGSAQYATIKVSSLAVNSTITAPSSNRSYRIINADATYSLTIKASGQTGVTFLPGQTGVVAFNGTDYVIVGVVGAGTATDNAVARFDGTTGKLVQNSVVTIADSTGDISGVGQLNATTVDATNIEVTNFKAKDGTAAASIADSTGIITVTTQLNVDNLNLSGNTLSSTDANGNLVLAPNGNGSVVITNAGTSNALRITQTGSGNALLVEDSTNPDSSPFVIDANGNMVNGYTSVITVASGTPRTQSIGGTPFSGLTYGDNATSGVLQLGKSRGASAGTHAILQSGDGINQIRFEGSDGTNFIRAAAIGAEVDGTPGTNDMPGRLVFSTTADGASSPTEKMRLDSSGNLGLGVTPSVYTANSRVFQVDGGANAAEIKLTNNTSGASGATGAIFQMTGNDLYIWNSENSFLSLGTNNTERARIDSSGNLGLGVTPSAWGTTPKALQVGAVSSFVGAGLTFGTNVGYNYFTDNVSDKYIQTGFASAYNQRSGEHRWYTAPSGTAGNAITFTQAMTLDASGNLGVGQTSPLCRVDIREANRGNTTNIANVGIYTTNSPAIDFGGSIALGGRFNSGNQQEAPFGSIRGAKENSTNNNYAGYLAFQTIQDSGVLTERARITSGGNLLVGETSGVERLVVSGTTNNYVIKSVAPSTSGTYYHIVFDDAGTSHGSITSNGTNTAYNTTSDYRLKDNPQPLTGSGAFIDALKPKTWNWKANGSRGVGFIAHEVQEVSPGSVVGEKDGEQMQAMEYGSAEFIANIIAELQSLRQRVALLEGN